MALTETSPGEAEVAPPDDRPAPPPRSHGAAAAGNDHKVIGTAFLALSVVALVAGGVLAAILRAQLAGPGADVLNEREYQTLLTYHGTITVFLFLLPAWIGLATAVVPLQIGAARLAFPRLQTLTFWLTAVGTTMVVMSAFASGGRSLVTGWSFNSPIPERMALRGDAVELLLLGLAVVVGAGVLATANIITTIVQLRAKGLTTWRLPLFTWSVLVSGIVLLLAGPVMVTGLGLLFADHHYGSQLFGGLTSSRAGNPLMWPRLFWFAAFPILWALVLPVLGLACETVTTFARRPIADRKKAMTAIAAIGVLSFFGWGTEVPNLPDRARLLFIAGGLVVLAATASVFLNILLTLREAGKEGDVHEVREGLRAVPMALSGGAMLLLAAGLGAAAISALDSGGSSHTNYWSVGQQHLLYFMPATIAVVAAVHFWGPKLWGRHLSAAMGKLTALLLVGGSALSFGAALWLGAQDMPVRTAVFSSGDGWDLGNLAVSAGAAVIGLGVLVFAMDLLVSIALRQGRVAGADPWGGQTLEWTTSSPPPPYNFDELPEVRSPQPALDLREAGMS